MSHPGSDDYPPSQPFYVPPAPLSFESPAPAPAAPPAAEPPTAPVEPPAAPVAPSYVPGSAAVPAQLPTPFPPPAVPTAPFYDPSAAGQAYPMSTGYQQYSAPPVSAPYGYAMPPPLPPKQSRVGIIVLSITTAVFLVTAGVFGTLFFQTNSYNKDYATQVDKLNGDIKTANTKTASLQKDVDSAKRDLDDAKSQVDELTKQRGVLADCINAIIDENVAFQQAGNKETADVLAKEKITQTKCAAAEKLL